MEINKKHKGNWWNEVLSALPERENELPHSGTYAELVDSLDIANALRLIQRKEMEIFRASLGIDGITLSRGTSFYVLPKLKNGINTDTVDGGKNKNKIVLTETVSVVSNPNRYSYSISSNTTLYRDVELKED